MKRLGAATGQPLAFVPANNAGSALLLMAPAMLGLRVRVVTTS